MSRSKPKTNRATNKHESSVMDQCQTPPYAVVPLLPYLRPFTHLWESACGQGYLVRELRRYGFTVSATDVLYGADYYQGSPPAYECQVTNVPFSHKYDWLARACQLGKPFALLMPSDALFADKFLQLKRTYPIEVLLPDRRINFRMPSHTRWEEGGAQMHTSWFTCWLNIGAFVTYVELPKPQGYIEESPPLFEIRDYVRSQPYLLSEAI